jgi:chromosome partitioning protein
MGLDSIRYTPKRLAAILGLSVRALAEAEARLGLAPAEPSPTDAKVSYSPADLARYRADLGRQPPPLERSKQLFLNFKGGTGKTSISTSHAFRLAERGYRVLVIDLDSQGHATKCLGLDGDAQEHTLADALIRRRPLRDVRVPTGYPGLDVVPSNLGMSTVELALMPLAGREFRLRNVLKDVEQDYDFVVMDAPPSFGLLNLNALMAADTLVVPVLPDFLSFHGLKLLFETVQSLEEDLQHVLDRIFIVINGFNATYRIAKEAREALEKHYSDYLLRPVVRQCTRFAQASSEGCPVFAYDPDSKGAEDVEAVVNDIVAALRPRPAEEPVSHGA